ncbi:uncharacterized protein PV09_01614 [Verruconis gallopava]|uniref:Phytoene desaturase n=1 Tax=Verruconis gallopava TaxID=253628 RepID=A0A0D2B8T7_9PEZI|nr:uncharacterized protein PV09_01614 [Verruconis gallopava]KIW07674.1 hypothetical protein PV09_01614 [Verruconis gallopava]
MYMGMSPFDAPGTYSLLQYTELAEGIWYPRGGFDKVIDGLVAIGNRWGVEYCLSMPVAQVTLSPDGRRATGVELEDGSTLRADLVVCNADLVYAYSNMLPQTAYASSLSTRKTSCSSISFYWAISQVVPELKTQNIFLSNDYRNSFDSIFRDHLIPEEPSFYVNVPSRVDLSAAPDGCDSMVVLVPVGHLLPTGSSKDNGTPSKSGHKQDWLKLTKVAREKVLSTIKTRTGVDLGSLILHEQINDPSTWKQAFNLDRGGILGLSHSFFNVLSFRPKTRHASISNLYFVGASTHPGTGVPICLAGAKIVATQIMNDMNQKIPWADECSNPASAGKEQNELDHMRSPPLTACSLALSAILLALTVAIYYVWADAVLLGSMIDWTSTVVNS